jgi:Tfp pilus assembly protein PilF
MYEKGGMPELALEDCNFILEKDQTHSKARIRKIRLLEGASRWQEALVEVCTVTLLHTHAHKHLIRMGMPIPPAPVSPSKMEELLNNVLPEEMQLYTERFQKLPKKMPSAYTILQLLKNYSNYNSWMAQAAKDGSVTKLTEELVEATDTAESKAKRAMLLLKRGRRHVYDRSNAEASADFEEAYALVANDDAAQEAMEEDSFARLLEWTGMVRHWHHNLSSAIQCYEKCSNLEPTNTRVLVMQGGVQMDAGKADEAQILFDKALGIDPSAIDALLQRSILYVLQGKIEDAKSDLVKLMQLKPNHVVARLRLAAVFAATGDIDEASRQIDLAENEDPKSTEVLSHRGELLCMQEKPEEAKAYFEKAIALEPNNPAPYLNCALIMLHVPASQGQMPDAMAIVNLLEKAIQVDPQYAEAYLQLGRLSLSLATDLVAAREVIRLYDRGLENCRTLEEVNQLCQMRIMAVAQVQAAEDLKMETFSMQ